MAPGIIEGRGDLGGFRGKIRRQPAAHALDFQKVAAIVGKQREGLNAYALDQFRRIRRADHRPDSLGALRNPQLQTAERHQKAAGGLTGNFR